MRRRSRGSKSFPVVVGESLGWSYNSERIEVGEGVKCRWVSDSGRLRSKIMLPYVSKKS